MDLKKKFNSIVKELGDEIGNLKTADEKKQFCKKYGLKADEFKEIISRYSDWTRNTVKDGRVVMRDSDKSGSASMNNFYRFRAGVTDIAVKRFEEEIKPDNLADVAAVRKEDEYDMLPADLRERLFKVGIVKYATTLTPEKTNEKVLDYLYASGYKGSIANPTVNFMYQMYVQGKEKDKAINELQGRVQKQDELIRYDAKLIDQLYGKAQKLQTCLQKSRQIVSDLLKSIRGIDNSIETSQKYSEQHESKGLFQRIKSIFSKPVPQLNAGNFLQTARDNCKIADQNAMQGIQQTRDEGLGQIQQGIQERNNLQRLVYSRGFSKAPEVSRVAPAPVRAATAPTRAPAPAKETKTDESKGFRPAGDDFEI
jgi:hypothetical protein